jgi:hypothetical protein
MPILNNMSTNLPGFTGGQSQQSSSLGTSPNLGETGGQGAQGNNPSFNPAAIMQSMGGASAPPQAGMQPGMSGMPPVGGGMMPPPLNGNSTPMQGMPQGNPFFAAMMR